MDITTNNITTTSRTSTTSSSSSWDLDMTMGSHLLHYQIPSISTHEFLNPALEQFYIHHLHTPPTFPCINHDSTQLDQQGHDNNSHHIHEQQGDEEEEGIGVMKEMMHKIAAMQPVDINPSTIKKPKRRNVRISNDPQSIAARHRRERISERIRILQQLVPGGTKMDTASMLDEAVRYVKFLKRWVQELHAKSVPQPAQVGHVAMDWGPSSSSSSSAMGAHSGLGFRFSGDRPSDGMG